VRDEDFRYIEGDTQAVPAMEVHLGEAFIESFNPPAPSASRMCIIWLNGKRWQGILHEVPEDEQERAEFWQILRESHGKGSNPVVPGQ
jgi:hypothetical protein